jgi:hypothetical protein
MPSPRRHLRTLLLGALIALAVFGAPDRALAQGKADTPKSKAETPKKDAAPELVLPSAESTIVLVRSTLLSLNDALRTGNYTVLRDLAAPSFRDANNAGRLHQIFANLSAQRIDLAAVAILPPKLPQPPSIDQDKRLRIGGYFPGEPVQLNFDLTFEAVGNQWRLFGISVNPVSAAINAPAEPRKAPPAAK